MGRDRNDELCTSANVDYTWEECCKWGGTEWTGWEQAGPGWARWVQIDMDWVTAGLVRPDQLQVRQTKMEQDWARLDLIKARRNHIGWPKCTHMRHLRGSWIWASCNGIRECEGSDIQWSMGAIVIRTYSSNDPAQTTCSTRLGSAWEEGRHQLNPLIPGILPKDST